MTRRVRSFFGVLLLSTLPLTTHAENQYSAHFLIEDWPLVLAGATTTLAAHELGHFVAGELENHPAYFSGVTIRYHGEPIADTASLRLSTSGYAAQWLASEFAFSRLNLTTSTQRRAYYQGMVLGHIGISLAYASVLKHHEDGDLSNAADVSGLSKNKLLLGLLIPAALDAWRLATDVPTWVPWLSRGSKILGFSWGWQF